MYRRTGVEKVNHGFFLVEYIFTLEYPNPVRDLANSLFSSLFALSFAAFVLFEIAI